jgi:hypothetical protein
MKWDPVDCYQHTNMLVQIPLLQLLPKRLYHLPVILGSADCLTLREVQLHDLLGRNTTSQGIVLGHLKAFSTIAIRHNHDLIGKELSLSHRSNLYGQTEEKGTSDQRH